MSLQVRSLPAPPAGDGAFGVLAQRLQTVLLRWGYQPADAPIIADAELFLTRAGDPIIHRLFTFEHGGRLMALRPEFTTPALHQYLQQLNADTGAKPPVVRWQFQGLVFEEQPASDTLHRYSVGAEIIGSSGALADAESIALAYDGLRHLGLGEQVVIRIGDLRLVKTVLTALGLDARLQRTLLQRFSENHADSAANTRDALKKPVIGEENTGQKPDAESDTADTDLLRSILASSQRQETMGGRTPEDILRRLSRKRQRAASQFQLDHASAFLERWSSAAAQGTQHEERFTQLEADIHALSQSLHGAGEAALAALHELRTIVETVIAFGVPAERIHIQPAMPRDWDYYTGVVFQIEREADGATLATGGRYDELARVLGASQDVPAVGFVYNAEHLATERTVARPVFSIVQPPVLPPSSEHAIPSLGQWLAYLRESGLSVQPDRVPPERAFVLVLRGAQLVWNEQPFDFVQREQLLQRLQQDTSEAMTAR